MKSVKKFLIKTIKIVNNFVKSIIKMIKKIVRPNKKDRKTYKEHIEFEEDTRPWIIHKSFTNEKDDKRGQKAEDSFKQMVKDISESKITSKISSKYITITMARINPEINQYKTIEISDNPYMTIVKHGTARFGIVIVKAKNKTYKVTSNHCLNAFKLDEIAKYANINPHVVVVAKQINDIKMKWVVNKGDEVQWKTYNYETGKHVYVETNVTYVILDYFKKGRRDVPTAYGIVVNIALIDQFVLSGTVMTVDEKPYIVTYATRLNDIAVAITAVAMLTLEREIRIEDA